MKNNKLIFILFLFTLIISIGYLSAPDNISGMLWGDGWFHSIYADQIFKLGYISYEDPYRMFNGLKIGGEVHNMPIHYTQFSHLSLGIFNHILGLNIFSYWYSLMINILLICFIFLFTKSILNKNISIIITLIYFTALASRLFYINFMEGFLLLQFFIFAYFFSKFYLTNNNKFLFLSIIFLAFFGITKHIGFFDSLLIFFLVNIYLLFKKQFKIILIINLLFFSIFIPPYYSLWNSIGTIGYGVGTLELPNFLPFKEKIQLLFTSKYQMPDDTIWYKLSYQKDKIFLQYIDSLFNYFSYFGGFNRVENININYPIILLSLVGIFKAFKNKNIILIGLFIVSLFEFMILLGKGLNFNQYIHIIIFGMLIFIFYGINNVFLKKHYYNKILMLIVYSLIFLIIYSDFYQSRGISYYNNVGRKIIENEKLYIDLGNYINSVDLYNGKNFIASDTQFPFYSKKRYIWLGDLMREDFNLKDNFNDLEFIEHFKDNINKFNLDYLIVSSQNYKQKGFYDYISPNIIKILELNNLIKLDKEIKINNNYWIKLYKIN